MLIYFMTWTCSFGFGS